MVVLIGDLHIKSSNKLEIDILLNDTITLIKERNEDTVIILGDTLDSNEKINMHCFMRVEIFIRELAKLANVYVLIGNHDRANNKVFLTKEHVFGPFKDIQNVFIVDDHIMTITWKGLKIALVPYVPNGKLMKAFKICGLNVKDFDLVCHHSEVANCSINKLSGSKCDIWEPDYPLAIGGHIHSFEIVANNMIYIGTPMQHCFGESPENKGIFILDENLELELIELNIPKKITIKIDYKDISTVVISPKDKTRLIIRGPKSMVKEILHNDEYKQKFKGVRIMFDDVSVKKKSSIEFRSNMSFIDRLKSSLDANPIMKEKFEKFFNID